MKTRNSTKSKLLSSVIALVLCVSMLIGATFAWFTDTASTGVNKIQAGNLDVQLLDATTGESLEGKTLKWTRATETGTELADSNDILWEPGCTYKLQPIVIKNAGNLILKYKITITGIQGSAKLNEAIDWTIVEKDANGTALSTALGADHTLAPGASNTLTIQGTMRTDAGNEYQGLSIDNIGITVLATQQTGEYDSIDNQYDVNAVYPVAPELSNTTLAGNITAAGGGTLGNITDTTAPTAAQISVPAGAVTADTNAVFSMQLNEVTPDSVTYEISLKDTTTNQSVTLASPATVTTYIGTGLINVVVKHSGVEMTKSTSSTNLTDGTFYYDKTTGKLFICTRSFSPFQIEYEFDGKASVNGVAYTTLTNALAAANEGETIVLMKDVSSTFTPNKNISLDLNGYTLKPLLVRSNQVVTIQNGYTVTIKNGTISHSRSGIYLKGGNNNLTLQDVTIDSKYIGVWSDCAGNTVEIENCVINSNYIGVYQNGSHGGNTFTIKNTNITDTFGLGVYISNNVNNAKQTLTIEGCTISGPSAVEMKHTNATITKSTLIGTATPTASGENGNGSCTAGYALAVTTNGANDFVTGKVSVSNTKFYSGTTTEGEPNGYVFVYQVADGASVSVDGRQYSNYNTYERISVNPGNIQDYLDGKYGSIDGKTLVLSEGNYGKLELGRATKYAGSNTDYYIGGVSEDNKKTFDEFVTIKNSGQWSASAYYVRNMSNVTLKAADGAAVSVAGLVASSGHVYGDDKTNTTVHDYVLDKDFQTSAYYLSQKFANITIEGITFTAKTEFATSSADTVIDGVTFKNCTFNIGNTASGNQALRYYNESNNGNVKNLTVDNCAFNTCYQGVYTQKINGVTVKNCTFNTTGHNAIAVQSSSEAVNHKAVVITGNTFKNIGDRIIRFGDVGADTQITIQNNTATDSGDTSGQVIKAQSLAEGVTYNISGNHWGEGKIVANSQFNDSAT